MADDATIQRARCPRCDRDQRCDVLGRKDVSWEDRNGPYIVSGQIDHRLLECRGCEQVFYWQESSDSEDDDHVWNDELQTEVAVSRLRHETWPKPEKADQRPDWFARLHEQDRVLQRIMGEMYEASDAGSLMLASVGLRTALDRAMEKLGINPGASLGDKVTALKDQGFIGVTEKDILDVVADAGNAAAHRGWYPDAEEFKLLLTALEGFVHRTVVQGRKALAVKEQIPARQPRPAKVRGRQEIL